MEVGDVAESPRADQWAATLRDIAAAVTVFRAGLLEAGITDEIVNGYCFRWFEQWLTTAMAPTVCCDDEDF